MKIGITGVAGFIGSHLADALLARGHKIVGVDDLSMGSVSNLQQSLQSPNFQFLKADVRDLRQLQAALHPADAIVHLAARKIPRYEDGMRTLEVNTLGTRHVLEIARDGRKRILLASTSDVYGKNPKLPFTESSDCVLGPSTVRRWSYAVSKLLDEHMALAYHSSFGVPVTILRFFGCYGPRHHLSWWGGPHAVFISAILQDQAVEIHGDGRQTRSFLYVADLVDGIVRALDHGATDAAIFNLGSPEEIGILELAQLIKEVCGTHSALRLKMVPYAQLGGNYEDVLRRVPDITLARRTLGFEPLVSTRDGLTRTIAWQKAAMGIQRA